MQKYDIHVCLISGQAAPNLLPILDPQFKPKKAIFLVSKEMKAKAEYLVNAFKSQGVSVMIEPLEDEFSFAQMEEQIINLVSQYENENIALNVTGGTKLISIAAANAFALIEKPIFYMDTEHNRIVFISKDENKKWLPDLSIQAKHSLEVYLSAYGVSLLKKEKDINHEQWLALAKQFCQYFNKYANDIPLLNYYASGSEKVGKAKRFKIDLEDKHFKINSFKELLDKLKYEYNLVEFYDKTIEFINERNRSFLNGGWLEEYTYQLLTEVNQIDDIALNAEVGNPHYNENKNSFSKENQGNFNEFDIAFIAKNKLHIIECKTKKMDEKPEEILYKLETLKDYGGLMTKKCLVSYFPIPDAMLNRARELKIEIIHAEDLKNLKAKLQNWIGKR